MKFLCASCERLAPISSFRAEGLTLVLVCSRCGAENRATVELAGRTAAAAPVPSSTPLTSDERSHSLSSPSVESKVIPLRPHSEDAARKLQATSADPFAVPPGRCPKCIAVLQSGTSSCPQCGLVFANADANEYRPPAPLDELWVDLLSRWNDSAAHDAFLARAAVQGGLAGVGRLYRLRLATIPDDRFALRGRDEVLRLAAVPSIVSPRVSEAAERPSRRWWIWVAFALALLLYAVLMLLMSKYFVASRQ